MSLLSKSKKGDASKEKTKKSDVSKSKSKGNKKDSKRPRSQSRPKLSKNKNIRGMMDKITFKIRKPSQSEENTEQKNQEKVQSTLVHDTVGMAKKAVENLLPALMGNLSSTKNQQPKKTAQETQDANKTSDVKEETGSPQEKTSDEQQLENLLYENIVGAVFEVNSLGSSTVTGDNSTSENTPQLPEDDKPEGDKPEDGKPEDDKEHDNQPSVAPSESPADETVTEDPVGNTARIPRENTIVFYHTSTIDIRFDKPSNGDACLLTEHASLDNTSLKEICPLDDYESLEKTKDSESLNNSPQEEDVCVVRGSNENLGGIPLENVGAASDSQNDSSALPDVADEHVGSGKYVEADATDSSDTNNVEIP